MILRIVIIFLFVSCSHFCVAQTGCLSVNGNLYTKPAAKNHGGLPTYSWNGSINDPNRTNNASSVYCLRNSQPNGCYIENTSSNNFDTGDLVDYSPLPCPIDDYIPLLFLVAGSLGFFYLNKIS